LQLIFSPFTQADTSTTRKYGGTGLGLTISSRLVGMMGGKIWVESEVGRGSRFCFTAHFDPPAAPEQGQQLQPHGEILGGVPILVVDDNETNRTILQRLLIHWHAEPTCVASGKEALAVLQEASERGKPYWVVLTDMYMPEMDGLKLTERIRRVPALTTTAVIMLTSGGRVASYLPKPVRRQELLASLLAACGQRAEAGSASKAVSEAAPRSAELRILLAEDNRVNQLVATRLLRKMGHTFAVANNGKEALALLAAQSFDLVLMDIQMPEMDGIEATRRIREEESRNSNHLPVIAMTAHAMKGDRERCLAAGMDGYISKPISASALELEIATVHATLAPAVPKDVSEETPRNRTPDSPTDDSRIGQPVPAVQWNRVRLLENLGGDEGLLRQIIDVFLKDAPRQIAEMRVALQARDANTIAKAAHSLKGSVGYFEVPEISDAAGALEEKGKQSEWSGTAELLDAFDAHVTGLLHAIQSELSVGAR
jgi:two-component system sensor histidine kinase/response regulator